MTKLKPWPTDPKETVAFDELMAPIQRTLKKLIVWKLRPRSTRGAAYDGYDVGRKEKLITSERRFTPADIRYHEERGESVVDMALQKAFLLGVEQGRRQGRVENDGWLVVLETLIPKSKDKVVNGLVAQAFRHLRGLR